MKNKIYVACFLTLLSTSFTAYTQVYKTAADTVKLNKELTEVNNDIADLNAKLTIAQNNMPGYQSKANAAESNAQDAAVNSSVQADKVATESSVKEARKAKRNSKKAYRKAKNARSANNNVGDQDDKIASLTGQLAERQERLRQLTAMRTAIDAKLLEQ